MSADSFIQDILRNASALRAAGVLRLTVDGCSVELAPHQPEEAVSNDEDSEDDNPEHPAFNPTIRFRQYHQDNKTS